MYRLIGRSTPRLRDFQSDRDKGRPRAPSQGYADYVDLSVFGSSSWLMQPLSSSNRGRALEHGHGFDLARTYADVAGHHAIWGEPSDPLEQVEAVLRHEASQ